MKVVKMTASRHVAERWYCQLENGETLQVSTALIADFSLYTGRDLDEAELRDITSFACASAGLSTTRPGGISSVPSYEDVRKQLEG